MDSFLTKWLIFFPFLPVLTYKALDVVPLSGDKSGGVKVHICMGAALSC